MLPDQDNGVVGGQRLASRLNLTAGKPEIATCVTAIPQSGKPRRDLSGGCLFRYRKVRLWMKTAGIVST